MVMPTSIDDLLVDGSESIDMTVVKSKWFCTVHFSEVNYSSYMLV